MEFPRRPQGVIFDMDGLLIDTIPLYVEAMQAAGAAMGHDISSAYLHTLIGLLGPELENRLAHDLGPEFPVADYLQKTGNYLAQLFARGVPLKPGARALVLHLHAQGVPCAVATSMQQHEARHQLASAGLLTYFAAVVGRGDVAQSKPHPAVYVEAAARLQLAPAHCLALEDSYTGIQSAHAAGCMVVMVPDVLPPTDATTALCVGVAPSLEEVKAAFGTAT